MPVFGKSLFETVLEGVNSRQEAAAAEKENAPAYVVRGLKSSFLGQASEAEPDFGPDPAHLYGQFAFDPPSPEPERPPVWLDRLSETEIAEDLDLASCRTVTELRERRRVFALENHPDRVVPDYRAAATIRMTIANQLIDRAIARLEA